MNDQLARIVDFVEGRLSPADFEQLLAADPGFQAELDNDPTLKRGTYIGISTYHFVISQDFNNPGGVLNVHGALTQFLDRREVAYQPTKVHHELHDILLSAQPRWLNVPLGWLQKNVLPEAKGRKKKELRDWLGQRLLELFRCRAKPPKWIQSPAWPIGENGPLVFLGQLSIPDYFHDEAAAYLFHDPSTGRCETVIQVY